MKSSIGLARKVALVGLLAGSLLTTSSAATASPPPVVVSHPGRPAVPDPVSVPVHPVVGTDVPVPATRTVPPPAPVWPGAGGAVADRTVPGVQADAHGWVRAGKLPVWVSPTSPAQVGVQVSSQASASAAGVKGMLLQ